MTGPLRAQDIRRHLHDLATRTFEGSSEWPDRVALFDRAVDLIDPLVRSVLAEADAEFLDGTGTVQRRRTEHDDGSVAERWELSWPRQRAATGRDGGPVPPVQVVALFLRTFTHPHLRGSRAGDWPLQVTSEADARRQEPILRALVEAELHQRIYEGRWWVVPSAVRRYGEPPAG